MINQELLPFNDQLHEDLFKLMILASNGIIIEPSHRLSGNYLVINFDDMEDDANRIINQWYKFQFNDRSIAPVMREGYIDTCFVSKSFSRDTKIIFHFEEEN